MKQVLIRGESVCKTFSGSGNSVQILQSIDVEIYAGDFTIIMGDSGAGKSTLLYALSGMDKITGGEIWYRDQEISHLPEKSLAKLRAAEFGFVFQQTHLVSNLTLFENVAVAGYIGNAGHLKEVQKKALLLLEKMHVADARNRLPSQVSAAKHSGLPLQER